MKKIISGLNIAVLLSCLFSPALFAGDNFYAPLSSLTSAHTVSVKSTASGDSALRTGTENWEQPQGNFFVVPAIVLGLVALVLFYKKD
jgi:hypothetical protein